MPKTPGYYQLNVSLACEGSAITEVIGAIYKNGIEFKRLAKMSSGGYITFGYIVYFDGVTDYVEIFGFIAGTSPNFASSTVQRTVFSGHLIKWVKS